MIMWSKQTKPCPIITWDGVVFNGEHHYVDHIYYMIHVRPFGLSVPRPYLHMLGLSSLTRVFCVCKTGLHPLYVNVELITPNHHVVLRNNEPSQWCTVRGNTFLKFYERSSYLCYHRSKQIRCNNMINISCNQIVTWYGQYHFAPFDFHLRGAMIIIVTGMTPWSPSSCLHEVVSPTDYFYYYS